jgi:uncharacterized protein DUF6265
MRATLLLPLAVVFISSTALPPRRPTAPHQISDLHFLEGTWHGRIGGRDFEARYTGSDGGQILSASKYTADGKSAGFEFERFEQRGDSVVLTPFPEGKASVTFRLAQLDVKGRRAVFENLAHDFPTRISYQGLGNDRLTILVSGPGEDGMEQVLTYPLRRK